MRFSNFDTAQCRVGDGPRQMPLGWEMFSFDICCIADDGDVMQMAEDRYFLFQLRKQICKIFLLKLVDFLAPGEYKSRMIGRLDLLSVMTSSGFFSQTSSLVFILFTPCRTYSGLSIIWQARGCLIDWFDYNHCIWRFSNWVQASQHKHRFN